mmetsp:Transcript_16249/g.38379  ORF Transcript_16249/g.38379 Transcript_16249/m.38379 type:complete len:848 (-) Transcript_16249:52-2595(-)
MKSEPLLPISLLDQPKDGGLGHWATTCRELAGRSDWLAVFLGPAISVPFATCYAALVCNDISMQHNFPVVLQQVMWTQMVGSIIALVIGQFVTTTNLDPLTAILFGQLARKVARFKTGQGSQEMILCSMMLLMPLISFCLGIVLYFVGKLKLAMMLRFIPYTVVGGFLAGSGILILQESLALAGGMNLGVLCQKSFEDATQVAGSWLQVGLSIGFSWILEYVREWHIFSTPLVIAAAVGLSVLAERFSGGVLPPRSWFLDFPDPVNWWEPFERVRDGLHQSYQASAMADLEFLGGFVVIMTVSWSINTLAVAKLVPLRPGLQRCDEQDEIRTLGLTNVLLGSMGGLCSMQSFKIPMMMRGVKSGPSWPYFNVVVNVLLFVASPRSIVQTVPRFLFAGTVVRLSCDLIGEWLLESRRRVAWEEWLVLVATAVVVVINVTLGILFGLFCTLAWFAIEYSGVTGVTHESTLSQSRSRVERSDEEHAVLKENGNETLVIWLSGYLFFGSACQVIDEVRSKISERDISVVILDFSHVPAIDASGVYAMVDLVQELHDARRVRLAFSGLVRRLHNALQCAAEHQQMPPLEIYHDLDKALQCYEDKILHRLPKTGVRAKRLRCETGVSKIDSLNCITALERAEPHFARECSNEPDGGVWRHLLQNELPVLDPEHMSVDILRELAGEPQMKEDGEVLFHFGSPATELIVLLNGAVDVTHPPVSPTKRLPRHHLNEKKGDHFVFEEQTRARRARAGAVFGAVEYASSSFNSDLELCKGACLRCTGTSVGHSEVLVISFDALQSKESQERRLALVLRTWLSRLASNALIASTHNDPLTHLHLRELRFHHQDNNFAVV